MAKPMDQKESEAVSFRTPFEAYQLGKRDFHKALATGHALECDLTLGERRDRELMRHWMMGVNHAELDVKARVPVLKIQARTLRA